jgi:hypothetical protein
LACVAEAELPDDPVKIVGQDGELFAAVGSLFCCMGIFRCQLRDMGGGLGDSPAAEVCPAAVAIL